MEEWLKQAVIESSKKAEEEEEDACWGGGGSRSEDTAIEEEEELEAIEVRRMMWKREGEKFRGLLSLNFSQ